MSGCCTLLFKCEKINDSRKKYGFLHLSPNVGIHDQLVGKTNSEYSAGHSVMEKNGIDVPSFYALIIIEIPHLKLSRQPRGSLFTTPQYRIKKTAVKPLPGSYGFRQ